MQQHPSMTGHGIGTMQMLHQQSQTRTQKLFSGTIDAQGFVDEMKTAGK